MATLEADTARWKLELVELEKQPQLNANQEDVAASSRLEDVASGSESSRAARQPHEAQTLTDGQPTAQTGMQDVDLDPGPTLGVDFPTNEIVAPNVSVVEHQSLEEEDDGRSVSNDAKLPTVEAAAPTTLPPNALHQALDAASNGVAPMTDIINSNAIISKPSASSTPEPGGTVTQISTAAQAAGVTNDVEAEIPGQVYLIRSISNLGGPLTLQQISMNSTSDLPNSPIDPPFSPYVSPLQYFQAFRYHPLYRETVQGGLKSITYSIHIDPKRALCPDELDGRSCPRGAACEFQHFKSMTVPGE
jgi:hypothetical protein